MIGILRNLTSLIEDSMGAVVSRRRKELSRKRIRLPTFCGPGLAPGVNLGDTAALPDLMDSHRSQLLFRADRP